MTNYRFLKLSFLDILIAFFILCFVLFSFLRKRAAGKEVLVYRENKIVKRFLLDRNLIFDVGNMRIEIRNKKVRVLKSNCPNKICVKSGWISKKGESIVCVPNRTLILIKGEKTNIDGITF